MRKEPFNSAGYYEIQHHFISQQTTKSHPTSIKYPTLRSIISSQNPNPQNPRNKMVHRTPAIILAFVVVVLGTSIGGLTAPDPSTPTCVVQLVPCYQFLKSTANVPDSCCNPMRDAVANQRNCLCKLYEMPGLLQTYNINITQVFGLTKACGVTATTDFCTASVAQSPSSAPAEVPGKDQNGAAIGKALWTELLGIQIFGGLIVTMW